MKWPFSAIPVLEGGTISIATAATGPAAPAPAGGGGGVTQPEPIKIRLEDCPDPSVFLIEYSDGFRGATLMLDGYLNAFAFAGKRMGSGGKPLIEGE